MQTPPRQRLKESLGAAALTLVGRRPLWRLGRAIYRTARRDVDNVPETNGERWLQGELLRLYAGEPRMVVFDAGANVGAWTRMLLEQLPAGEEDRVEVHAFEPVASTFETLARNLAAHPHGNRVRTVNAALSEADGTLEIIEVEANGTTNSLHPDPFQAGRRVPIRTERADGYCERNGIERVHLLKIDTEGHEVSVLRGAERLFREERVMVAQLEYNHRWVYSRHFLKDVFDLVRDTPYAVGKLTPRALELYEDWHFELERFFEANYVLVHPSVVDRVATVHGTFTLDDNTYG
jgi:FkbM family methyltransferase